MKDGRVEFTNLHIYFATHGMNTQMPRKRKSETVIYTIGGEVSVTEKNARYDFLVREGELVYLPSGDSATLRIPEDAKAVIIKFDLRERLFEDAFCIKKGSEVLETAGKLCEYTDRDHVFFCMMTYKLIYEMKKYVAGQAPQKFHKLYPVIDELRAHPEAERKIDEYAKMCGMSEVGFRKLFMEYTGETPVEYRTRLRLEMACGMLADGECSVTEAAARSGFNSISFFCREFKKFYGYSAGNISQKS